MSATATLPEQVSKGAAPLWPPEAIMLFDNFTMNLLQAVTDYWPMNRVSSSRDCASSKLLPLRLPVK